MGSWGPAPWESDSAADWFAKLFASSDIVQRVEKAFSLDPLEYHEEIRAAAWLLAALGRVYVWPDPNLPHLLDRAIAVLQAVKESGVVEDGEAVVLLDEEIDTLTRRRASIRRA